MADPAIPIALKRFSVAQNNLRGGKPPLGFCD
jgi:hypothetical protein